MTQNEWMQIEKHVDQAFKEMGISYSDYKNPSTSSFGLGKYNHQKDSLKRYIKKIPELYNLVTGGDDVNDYARAMTFTDFLMIGRLDHDARILLTALDEKVNMI